MIVQSIDLHGVIPVLEVRCGAASALASNIPGASVLGLRRGDGMVA